MTRWIRTPVVVLFCLGLVVAWAAPLAAAADKPAGKADTKPAEKKDKPPRQAPAREDALKCLDREVAALNKHAPPFKDKLDALRREKPASDDARAAELLSQVRRVRAGLDSMVSVNFEAMRRAVRDMAASFADRYPQAQADKHLAAIADYEKRLAGLADRKDEPAYAALAVELLAFRREVLLANPLLDGDRLLVLRRHFGANARNIMGAGCGFPSLNSHTNDTIPHTGWDNEIALVTDLRTQPRFRTLYRTEQGRILRDIDLEFDAGRIMFSSIGANDRWAIFEIAADGSGLKQLTPADLPDVDFFDSCYLPDGRFVSCSTAGYQGLPCENGGKPMVNLYLCDTRDNTIQQLTFEQDSDYHPAVLPNGRVLYLRWEYSDIQHYYSRILFSCNPDGTGQMEVYGSGSYFPTAFKHARPVPGHPSKIVGIISGHHSTPETGRLAIIDPSLSRKYPFKPNWKTKEWGPPGSYINVIPEVLPASRTGFVQEIPGYGKDVVGNVHDGQGHDPDVFGTPHFVYPYPLSEKYCLVSMKTKGALWGIYLVDVFDNLTLIAEEEGFALFEPIPFQKQPRPPVVPDRIQKGATQAAVYVTDIYDGPGLRGVPRGTVKNLRLFAYHFAYMGTGGHTSVGVESSWDIKRILGTVPVESDGSAYFYIPANTPVSIQPLDEQGRAVQLMRSWLVGRPGENVACAGCHEAQSTASANKLTAALARRRPADIAPFYGPERPYCFPVDVYPVLEKHCAGCHDGKARPDGRTPHSFKDAQTAYKNFHPYVRRPGPESEMDMFYPMEWHASTSPIEWILRKGHHGVELDRESWDRLYCWIDLNAPWRGSWNPPKFRGQDQAQRRRELAERYAGVTADPDATYARLVEELKGRKVEFVPPKPFQRPPADSVTAPGWPLGADKAADLARAGAGPAEMELELAPGVTMKLLRVPAGQFVMGSQDGYLDEQPRAAVKIDQPFYMSLCEVSNAQYACFDPAHDTRYYDEHGKDQAVPGYIGNHRDQPVARISWQEAMAFCQWLSRKTGRQVTLPTEAQWEWAARAGTAGPFYYGEMDAVFSDFANLADNTRLFAATSWDGGSVIHKLKPYDAKHHYPLRDDRSNDKSMVTNYVGQYKPNAFGLKDMIGNVSEWTLSAYAAYPYRDDDGRNDPARPGPRTARGGCWEDRPRDATASTRFSYQPWQKVYSVGFRVVIRQ